MIDPTEIPFVGSSEYLDRHPDRADNAQSRIYVKFYPAGSPMPHLALLDTGAHYCILAPEIVESAGVFLGEPIGWRTFQTAFGRIRGQLFPYSISLLAEYGEPLDIEVIAMVCKDWQAPTYLGYTGVLDRIQFALQPHTNRIYFGPLT